MKAQTRTLAPVLVVLALLFAAALACNAPSGAAETPTAPPTPIVETLAPPPTEEPRPTDTPFPTEAPVPGVQYEGISFSYERSLATNVLAETIPAEEPSPEGPYWEGAPEHVQFSFEGYPLQDTFHRPQIYVYPVGAYEQLNEAAAETIADLREYLATGPTTDSIPFLPLFNAAQVLRTKVSRLEFQNGRGVRFVTQYNQAPIPINNQELFYTFQGLRQDDGYYMAAVLPISNATLPADGTLPANTDFEDFADNFQSYVAQVTQQLDAQPDSSFVPDIAMLDRMIQSFQIR